MGNTEVNHIRQRNDLIVESEQKEATQKVKKIHLDYDEFLKVKQPENNISLNPGELWCSLINQSLLEKTAMRPVYRFLLSAVLVPCITVTFSGTARARQTIVSGSVATGYDLRDRTYDQGQTESSDDDQQKIFISPTITISSQGVSDLLSFHYSPRLNYDFVDDENSVDHNLGLSAQRMLTSRWSMTVSDQYTYSDDPESFSTMTEGGQPSDSGEPSDTLRGTPCQG